MIDYASYQPLAMRTQNYEHSASLRFVNAVLGIIGELHEVDQTIRTNGVADTKELGDVCWYVAAVCDALDLKFGALVKSTLEQTILYQSPHHLHLAEIAKKWHFHNKYPNPYLVRAALASIMEFVYRCTLTPLQQRSINILPLAGGAEVINAVLDTNIKKLTKRYPNRFEVV